MPRFQQKRFRKDRMIRVVDPSRVIGFRTGRRDRVKEIQRGMRFLVKDVYGTDLNGVVTLLVAPKREDPSFCGPGVLALYELVAEERAIEDDGIPPSDWD